MHASLKWMSVTPYKPEMATKDNKHKYANDIEEEAEESTAPPKKQRMNGRGVGHILLYIE
jgi:hypothetical protein